MTKTFTPTANLKHGWVVGHDRGRIVARFSLDAPKPGRRLTFVLKRRLPPC